MEEQAIRNIADVQSGKEKPAEQTQKPEDKLLPEHVMGPFLIREISRDNPQMEEGGFYRDKKTVQLIGASGTQKAMAAAMACGEMDGPAVIVAPSARDLRYWEMDLHFFMPERKCIVFPVIEKADASVNFSSTERLRDRMRALSAVSTGEPVVILATSVEAAQKLPEQKTLLSQCITLTKEDCIEREDFLARLTGMGYERVDQVERCGHFSVRGDIIDIFPINKEHPLRIEFFDDEIDGMRWFNEDTQRSIRMADKAIIFPISYEGKETAILSDYLKDGLLILDEPHRGEEQLKSYFREEKENALRAVSWKELVASGNKNRELIFSLINRSLPGISCHQSETWPGQTMTNYQRQIPLFITELQNLLSHGWKAAVVIPDRTEYMEIEGALSEAGIPVSMELEAGKVTLARDAISGGFELPNQKIALIAAGDILGRQKIRRFSRAGNKGRQIRYFSDLNVGDYVVQDTHGIGRYIGLRTIELEGVHRDYVTIQYSGGDKLYLPMNQISTLEKYIGPEGTTPVLSKMGGAQWDRVKSKAGKSIRELAERLLKVYAEREITPGIAFDKDNIMQREFEDSFPYIETPDQLSAIQKIKEAMEKPQPMDMLLCGDVGFGKTEVAMRAVFKCVVSGYQAMVLVPTTVLSQQHYKNFVKRMEPFGIRVAVLNRFVSPKEKKLILQKLAAGEIDVIIGTHAILNKKIHCHKLGLLVVDEEQRFGVVQKEKWKSWSAGIDVLALSATPIPRTLHMSLTGVRDMATLTQAPANRHAIQTYVTEYDDNLVRDAIIREKERHGQTYFIYNRIDTIEAMQHHLRQILPEDVSIVIAHGRMDGRQLEDIMVDFYAGKFDVLLCTTLIENGIDQPNANTMLVYDADRLGLSQIYQMRGRVGRSEKIARAYFFYRKGKILSEVAEKRLDAIREFTELGSGFKIAMRDLEIRGAGNLLGSAQHGNIANIGFSTYCTMLEDAINTLKAERENKPKPKKLPATIVDFRQDAYLDPKYIPKEEAKMEIYRRLSLASTEEEVSDLLDEVIDRFGNPTAPVIKLFNSAKVRTKARHLGIGSILDEGGHYLITWADTDFIKGWNPARLPVQYLEAIHILPGAPSRIQIDKSKIRKNVLVWFSELFTAIEQDMGKNIKNS